MKLEYDLSSGERNRYYLPDAVHEFPVYLESDVREALVRFARDEGLELADLVNKWLRMNIAIVESKRSAA